MVFLFFRKKLRSKNNKIIKMIYVREYMCVFVSRKFETNKINEGFLITFVVFYLLPGCRLLFFLVVETDKPCHPYRHHKARTFFHTITSSVRSLPSYQGFCWYRHYQKYWGNSVSMHRASAHASTPISTRPGKRYKSKKLLTKYSLWEDIAFVSILSHNPRFDNVSYYIYILCLFMLLFINIIFG